MLYSLNDEGNLRPIGPGEALDDIEWKKQQSGLFHCHSVISLGQRRGGWVGSRMRRRVCADERKKLRHVGRQEDSFQR